MEIIKKRIADMERAEYNPRVELMPGDDEYEKLKRNIDRFGMVVPVIWNRRTNRVVSGHQRLTVLMNEGVTEVDVSVVDLDETAEKQLNIAMNKVTGEWDEVKLKELLDGLGDAAPETGFDLYEIEALENNVDALVDGDFLDSELKSIEETFNISLKFSAEDRDVLKEYIKENGKEDLVAVIVQKIRARLFFATCPCVSIPTVAALTDAGTASRRRRTTSATSSVTKAWTACAPLSRASAATKRSGATGTFLSTGAA